MADREISDILIRWYEENKRDLPWRRTSDPYLIWISEIILQQTRVVQGLEYFCLLYTNEAADDQLRVYLGGRRIIKKYFLMAW